MPFDLKVTFAGLCLYVNRRDLGGKVSVLMPDCRRTLDPFPVHPDLLEGEPHAGFLRFDLANLDASLPSGMAGDDAPRDFVRRFRPADIELVPDSADPITVSELVLPSFELFSPPLKLRDDVLGTAPPGVLMRTVLNGGTLFASGKRQWKFHECLKPGAPRFNDAKTFAGRVSWSRTINTTANTLTVVIREFGSSQEVKIALKATRNPINGKDEISLMVANLCGGNLLDWKDLKHDDSARSDRDFKWLYHLLEPVQGTWPEILNGCELPFLEVADTTPSGFEHCIGGRIGFGT